MKELRIRSFPNILAHNIDQKVAVHQLRAQALQDKVHRAIFRGVGELGMGAKRRFEPFARDREYRVFARNLETDEKTKMVQRRGAKIHEQINFTQIRFLKSHVPLCQSMRQCFIQSSVEVHNAGI